MLGKTFRLLFILLKKGLSTDLEIMDVATSCTASSRDIYFYFSSAGTTDARCHVQSFVLEL